MRFHTTLQSASKTATGSQKQWFVLGIEEAKKPETRQRRIDKAVARLLEGRAQR